MKKIQKPASFCYICVWVRGNVPEVQTFELHIQHQIMIIQPGETNWHPIDCDLPPYRHFTNSICIDNVIYYGIGKCKSFVVCVDLRTQTLVTNELPKNDLCVFGWTKLRSFNGQPCFVNDDDFELTSFEHFSILVRTLVFWSGKKSQEIGLTQMLTLWVGHNPQQYYRSLCFEGTVSR